MEKEKIHNPLKQEKKNKILTGTLIALIISVSIILLLSSNRSAVDKERFRIANLAEVDKVVFESNERVELVFNGSRWLVDEDYRADDQLVTVLFATLQQVEAKRKVAASMVDSIARSLRENGVKVSLYRGSNLEGEFIAGGNAAKTEAYFMDSKEEPFVMTIPGYRVYVSGIFELDQKGWRDKRIFNFNWRNFKSLHAQFNGADAQSFQVEDLGNGFDILNTTGTDTTKLNDYLDAVSLLVAKDFIRPGKNKAYDSMLQTTPELTIEISDLGDNKFTLDIYHPLEGDELVAGKLNGSEGVVFDIRQVASILRARQYFMASRP